MHSLCLSAWETWRRFESHGQASAAVLPNILEVVLCHSWRGWTLAADYANFSS